MKTKTCTPRRKPAQSEPAKASASAIPIGLPPSTTEAPLAPPRPLRAEAEAVTPKKEQDTWVELRQTIDAMSDERITAGDNLVVSLKPWIGESLKRGYFLPERDRAALRCLLGEQLKDVLLRWDLATEAIQYRHRMRIAKHAASLRAARLAFKEAIALAKLRGAGEHLLEQCERLLH